jgi:hypothetical protein
MKKGFEENETLCTTLSDQFKSNNKKLSYQHFWNFLDQNLNVSDY